VADFFRFRVLALLFVSTLLFAGCVQQQAVCNKPYILVGNGCCLDKNDNKICDADEAPDEQAPSRAAGMVVLSEHVGKSVPVDSTVPEENGPAQEEMPVEPAAEAVPHARFLRIVYMNGTSAACENVLIDGIDAGSGIDGAFSLKGITEGEHRSDILIDSVSFFESFTYSGEDVFVKIDPMAKVKGVVQSKGGELLSDVNVYCDNVSVGVTDDSGAFEFAVKRGSRTIRLQGPGIYEEGLHDLRQEYTSLRFNLERKYSIRVSVIDSASGDTVTDARIYLDGQAQNKTGSDELIIPGVAEGTHDIEASCGGVSVRRSILVAKEDQAVELSLKIPKNISLKIVDRLSGDPVSGARISLDGEEIGLTAPDGTILLDSAYAGEYVVEISYLDVTTSRSIDLSDDEDVITFGIDLPFDVTIEIKDTETGKSVSGWNVILKNQELTVPGTRTGLDGKTVIKSVIPGSYHMELSYPAGRINVSEAGKTITIGNERALFEKVDIPNPRYSGSLTCSEHGVYNKMGRCEVSVKNVEYERSMPSYDVDVFLFVFTESNASGADRFELAGRHLKSFSFLSPGEVYSGVFDPLPEFEGDKKEAIVVLILDDWEYSPENEVSVGGNDVSPSDLSILVRRIKERCSDESAECMQVLEKKIVGILAAVN
jgi:hypothetical protein